MALRRDVLGLPKRKGRHPVLSEEQEMALWQRWQPAIKAREIEFDDDAAMLDLAMELAETLSLPMSVIWATIRSWIDQGLA